MLGRPITTRAKGPVLAQLRTERSNVEGMQYGGAIVAAARCCRAGSCSFTLMVCGAPWSPLDDRTPSSLGNGQLLHEQ